MKKPEKLFKILKDNQLIALLSPKSPEQCIKAYEILSPLGITLEIAFRTDVAEAGIRAVLDKYPEALILAGTVMTKKQAEKAVTAGVAGLVSADYIPEVVEIAVKQDLMSIPGGVGDAGKQLVQKAYLLGCDLAELREKYPYQWIHKVFPAVAGSVNFYEIAKAWKGPYKGLQVIYTGGVSYKNLVELASFDMDGIFCGSALCRLLDDPNKMREDALDWMTLISKSQVAK